MIFDDDTLKLMFETDDYNRLAEYDCNCLILGLLYIFFKKDILKNMVATKEDTLILNYLDRAFKEIVKRLYWLEIENFND